MPRLRADVAKNTLISNARTAIAQAAGDNGILSKKEQQGLPEDYAKAADYARQAKRANGERATVDVSDVTNNYASYVNRVVSAVNTKGEAFLSKAETKAIYDENLQGRIWDIRSGALPVLSADERLAKARDHLLANIETGTRPDAIYPAANSGEMGLLTYLAEGAAAERIAAFANAWYGNPDSLKDFDPAKHSIIAARVTEDEESLFVTKLDKVTGEATVIGEMDVVDLSYSDFTKAQFEAIVGPLSQFGATELDEVDHYELIDVLVEPGTTPIDLSPKGGQLVGGKLADAFEAAATLPDGDELTYFSEGDYPVRFTEADNPGNKSITPERVLEKFGSVIEREILSDWDPAIADLTWEVSSKAETQTILNDLGETYDGAEPYELDNAGAFAEVADLMKNNLSDLKFFRFGPKDDDGTMAVDAGTYVHMIVGKTADGHLGAMYYGSVET